MQSLCINWPISLSFLTTLCKILYYCIQYDPLKLRYYEVTGSQWPCVNGFSLYLSHIDLWTRLIMFLSIMPLYLYVWVTDHHCYITWSLNVCSSVLCHLISECLFFSELTPFKSSQNLTSIKSFYKNEISFARTFLSYYDFDTSGLSLHL